MEKVFNLSSKLYREDFIERAIKDFNDVATIKFNNFSITIIWDNDDEIEEVFNESLNYIISLEC